MTQKAWYFAPALLGFVLLGCVTASNGVAPSGNQQNPLAARVIEPKLVIPLDNIGIADWRFLNPRSPQSVLPKETEVPKGAALLPELERAKIVATAIAGLSPARLTAIQDILDIGNRAAQNLDSVQPEVAQQKEWAVETVSITTTRSTLVRRTLQAAWKASDENPALRPADPATLPDDFCPPAPLQDEKPSQRSVIAETVTLTCNVAVWALKVLELVPAVGVDPVHTIGTTTLGTVASAGRIISNQLPHQADTDIANARASTLLRNTRAAWEGGRQEVDDVTTDSNLKEGTRRTVAELTAQKVKATLEGLRGGADAEAEESTKAQLQQMVVRFINRTFDRSFIVSLQLQKDLLLRAGRTDCLSARDKKDVDSAKINCLTEDYGNDISFSVKDNVVTASFTVGPQLPFDLDAWLLSKAPKAIVPFDVDFFDQTDDPAYSQGFIALHPIDPKDLSAQPDDKFTTNLITGITGKNEPCFGTQTENCAGKITAATPYDGDTRRHLNATGQLDLSQSLGSRANVKLSLQYRNSDLGGKDASKEKVGFSQYQVNIFGTNNTIFSLGKFTFAQPSNKIAIFEEGDGLRLTYRNAGVSYILRRESNDGISDSHDKDSYSLLGEYKQLITSQFIRRIDMIYLRGKDGCKPSTETDGACTAPDYPHTYSTYGAEMFFTIPVAPARAGQKFNPMTGSLAAYYSDVDSRKAGTDHPDGDGSTFLLTLGRPFGFVADSNPSKVKPQRVLTGLVGWGSGDDPSTPKNEGYVGERAGFARDLLFMSGLVKSLDDNLQKSIGPGLSNKTYVGLQYSDNHISPLQWITVLLDTQDDVVSQSMTFSIHNYRFHEAILGKREAGTEYDADFRIEVPKNVKWRVTAGYFQPGNALNSLTKNALTISAGIVLEPGRLF